MNGRFGLRNSDTIFINVDSTTTVPLCFSTVQAGKYYTCLWILFCEYNILCILQQRVSHISLLLKHITSLNQVNSKTQFFKQGPLQMVRITIIAQAIIIIHRD